MNESLLATFVDRLRFTAAVAHQLEHTREFPYDKANPARAY